MEPRAAPLRDGAYFGRAYRELRPRARAIAARVLGDAEAAEDVVQEVFLDLWRRPRSFDPARGSLSSYVGMLARCRALDRRRADNALGSAHERSQREHARDRADAESAQTSAMRHESSRRVLDALDGLPQLQREALLLAYGYGLSTREVATVAHVPLGTAKSRLRLGLRRARVTLERAA